MKNKVEKRQSLIEYITEYYHSMSRFEIPTLEMYSFDELLKCMYVFGLTHFVEPILNKIYPTTNVV